MASRDKDEREEGHVHTRMDMGRRYVEMCGEKVWEEVWEMCGVGSMGGGVGRRYGEMCGEEVWEEVWGDVWGGSMGGCMGRKYGEMCGRCVGEV